MHTVQLFSATVYYYRGIRTVGAIDFCCFHRVFFTLITCTITIRPHCSINVRLFVLPVIKAFQGDIEEFGKVVSSVQKHSQSKEVLICWHRIIIACNIVYNVFVDFNESCQTHHISYHKASMDITLSVSALIASVCFARALHILHQLKMCWCVMMD